MNFLRLKPPQHGSPQKPHPPLPPVHKGQDRTMHRSRSVTLQCLISQESFPEIKSNENVVGIKEDGDHDVHDDVCDIECERFGSFKGQIIDTHVDVTEDEGWISIPCKQLQDNWREFPEIGSFRSSDRSFVFPGEQVHILVCLSACKQDIEVITPFKVAAILNKNSIKNNTENQNDNAEADINTAVVDEVSDGKGINQRDDSGNCVSSEESLVRMDNHRRKTEKLLRRFNESHFFVRMAGSDEPLWSKSSSEASADVMGQSDDTRHGNMQKQSSLNAVVDRGNFDSSTSSGIARDGFQCHALINGDIVVLLQINVGVDVLSDPVLEVLQFERDRETELGSQNHENLAPSYQDPCGELLRWLLPMDNPMGSLPRTESTPAISGPSTGSLSTISNFSALSGPQIFSRFRSYSMSSLPPNNAPTPTVTAPSSRASFDPEEWIHYSYQKSVKTEKNGSEGLLSFRGVPLEPERFSVRCGLKGIYIPGIRWRRKIEIIQPVEINSFAAGCGTDDLICVQIKNITPAHASNILVYVDAISIVSEDPSTDGLSSSFPIACVEAGKDHSLPNLVLRRGEEHSFILKPALFLWKLTQGQIEGSPQLSRSLSDSSSNEMRHNSSSTNQYAIHVSCRCNYTESRLFFKQPTSWQPRMSHDLLISVASDSSRHTLESNGKFDRFPIQVVTLHASNLTSEDLTLTVLASASFTSPPNVVSLSQSLLSPLSPHPDLSELSEKGSDDRQSVHLDRSHSTPANDDQEGEGGSQPVLLGEQTIPISEVLSKGDLVDCTHLWLQSKVPLGCVRSQCSVSIKLEVLPLIDGIITLDSLQIHVKERGVTYIPEHSLKLNAKWSIFADKI